MSSKSAGALRPSVLMMTSSPVAGVVLVVEHATPRPATHIAPAATPASLRARAFFRVTMP